MSPDTISPPVAPCEKVAATTTAAAMAQQIRRDLGHLPAGALRLFGSRWLGAPMHTVYQIVGVQGEGGALVVDFARGERLTVWGPEGYRGGPHEFRIGGASRARWEWLGYGVLYPRRQRFYREYAVQGTSVRCRTNLPEPPGEFEAGQEAPVVELLDPWDASAVTEARRIAGRINGTLDRLQAGALRLFGMGPVPPESAPLRVVGASCRFETLMLHLSDGSLLLVGEPEGYDGDGGAFRIARSSRVRWEPPPERPAARRARSFRTYVQRRGAVECWSGFGMYDCRAAYEPRVPAVQWA